MKNMLKSTITGTMKTAIIMTAEAVVTIITDTGRITIIIIQAITGHFMDTTMHMDLDIPITTTTILPTVITVIMTGTTLTMAMAVTIPGTGTDTTMGTIPHRSTGTIIATTIPHTGGIMTTGLPATMLPAGTGFTITLLVRGLHTQADQLLPPVELPLQRA